MTTRDNRASVLGLIAGLALVLPNPDGAALNQGDRQQVALCYRGISSAAITTFDAFCDTTLTDTNETRTITDTNEARTITDTNEVRTMECG